MIMALEKQSLHVHWENKQMMIYVDMISEILLALSNGRNDWP
jgi:hypothetical protein